MARVESSTPTPVGHTLQFMQQLWGLAHALQVTSKRMARTIGVTGPQRLVIRVVGQRPGINARDLAATLGLHPSTLTGVLARLEGQRLVDRSIDPADRRRAKFTLTAAGRKVDQEKRGTVEAAVRRALTRATPADVAGAGTLIALLVSELTRPEAASAGGRSGGRRGARAVGVAARSIRRDRDTSVERLVRSSDRAAPAARAARPPGPRAAPRGAR